MHRLSSDPGRRCTPARRWQPLDDAEWGALLPFVLVRDRPPAVR